jgi:hypothetical protein
METDTLIEELNLLWEPIRPYLARQIEELYGRRDGRILESLFQVDFSAIHRTLRTEGIAFIGGGFGKYTPSEIISQIGKRSEQLNAAMGRVRITVESVRDQLRSSTLEEKCEITTDGGLWVVLRK